MPRDPSQQPEGTVGCQQQEREGMFPPREGAAGPTPWSRATAPRAPPGHLPAEAAGERGRVGQPRGSAVASPQGPSRKPLLRAGLAPSTNRTPSMALPSSWPTGQSRAGPGCAHPPCLHFPSWASCPQETRPHPACRPPHSPHGGAVLPSQEPSTVDVLPAGLGHRPWGPRVPLPGQGGRPRLATRALTPPHTPCSMQGSETGEDPQGDAAAPRKRWPHSGARSLGGSEGPQTPALLLAQIFRVGCRGAPPRPHPADAPPASPLCLPQHRNPICREGAAHTAPEGTPKPGAVTAAHPAPQLTAIHPKMPVLAPATEADALLTRCCRLPSSSGRIRPCP